MKLTTTITTAVAAGALLLASELRAQEVAAPNPKGQQVLTMVVDDTTLRVKGGAPFDPCAILIGLEERAVVLPGNALLGLNPLAVLVQGDFDEFGEYSFDFGPLIGALKDPITIYVQAITIVQDSTFFATSNVVLLGIATLQISTKVDAVHVDNAVATVGVHKEK